MHLPGLQSEGPPHVFQLMGFICACHVVSVITKEEDSCKCVTTSLLQNPIIDLPAPPGSGGGEERLQAGHRGLRAGLLKESPSPGGSGLLRDGEVRGCGHQGSAHPKSPSSEGFCAAGLALKSLQLLQAEG